MHSISTTHSFTDVICHASISRSDLGIIIFLLKVKLSHDPVCLSVGWIVGGSVCHNFLEGREVSLLCSYRSTCFYCRSISLAMMEDFRYRVFIKYCVFSLIFFSELCQFCCSASFLPAWSVYTH